MKFFFIVLSFFLFFFSAIAQERLGIVNSNFSSTNSVLFNPSASADSRAFIQFNLVGANAYAMTNLGYIPGFSLWSAAKGNISTPEISAIKLKKFVYANASVQGPSVIVSNRKIGVGFLQERAQRETCAMFRMHSPMFYCSKTRISIQEM